MAEITSYEPGTPCWVDLGARDIPGVVAFYNSLFGWEATEADEASGGYRMLTLKGKNVAGLGPAQNPGPTYWTSYVSVADLDETLLVIEKEGGSVIVPAMDVMDAGRMAVASDPTGAVISLWQPGLHIGAQLVNEHGTLCWNELNTRDVAASTAFYTAVFGWTAKSSSGDADGMDYTEFQVNGRSIAGMMAMSPDMPAEVPSHWLVYFAVDDADAAVERALAAGGSKVTDLMDIAGVGRFGMVSDPDGAPFAVIKMNEAAS